MALKFCRLVCFKFCAVTFFCFGLMSGMAYASAGEMFGVESRAAALANATAAWGFDGNPTYYNPAGLGVAQKAKLQMNLGIAYYQPKFRSIDGVVLSNDYTSDSALPLSGDVNVGDYRAISGAFLSGTLSVLPQYGNLTLGIWGFVPLEHLAVIDTGQTFIPEYVLFRARPQRPQLEFALSATPSENWSFGLGLRSAFNLTSNATLFLQTDTHRASSMKFSASLKPHFMPYMGVLYTDSQAGWSLGAVLRLPTASKNQMTVNAGARALGTLAALDFALLSDSIIYYDPLSVELGASVKYADWGRIYTQVDFQGWSRFKPPSLEISAPDAAACAQGSSTCGVTVAAGPRPQMDYKNIWLFKAGHELYLDQNIFRVGYSYRQSIIKTLPVNSANYLDPPRHSFAAGWGYVFDEFLGTKVHYTLDVHANYELLASQTIVKDLGDENNMGSINSKIGAPGYRAGGRIVGGGVSLGIAL